MFSTSSLMVGYVSEAEISSFFSGSARQYDRESSLLHSDWLHSRLCFSVDLRLTSGSFVECWFVVVDH